VPYEGERILEQETFTPEVLITPDGSTVLDFKQNLFGYVWFKVNGKKGQKVALIHGECLDESGNFTLKNLGARINNFQRIDYVLKDGVQEYKPTFTAHGFRYVKLIAWPEKVVTENFKSIAVYSEMEEIGTFECSNPMVNRLINNVKWSQRSNFLDIPTDCPTRERAGWTGDISVFAETGSYLFNTNKFLNKWLKDLALQQFDNGIIPNTIPNVMLKMIGFLNGSAGWGDVCYTVPLTLYKMYGNKSTLERQYKSMVKWVGFNERRARRMHWTNLFRFGKESKYIVDRGYHWGEWLEPNHVMVLDSIKSILFKGDAEVATAYFAYSTKILSEIAGILGNVDDRKKYMDLHLKIKDAYLNAFCKNGVIKSDRQCKYVRPLAMDLIGGETANNIALQLNDLVIENGYKIGTGFLSTPWILKVLSDHGYTETAYKMLENTERPSWLYEVKKGATTTWENWNGINDDNVPNNSLNHYAPGAVVAWLFNSVAGIRPLEAGFKKVLVKPIVGGSLTYVNCSYKSAAGKIDIQWRREGDAFKLKLTTPVATEIVLPDGAKFTVNAGSYDYSCKI
jgi:alpha-L-rhamnosidase